VHITTKVVNSNPAHSEVYSIQLYVIKFVSYLRQVDWFSRGTPVSSTNKTDRNNITEVLLKEALYTTTLTPICIHIFVSMYDCLFVFITLFPSTTVYLYSSFCFHLRPGLALSQLDQLLPFEPRDGVIYSRLFKYIQQHTAGFTENNWAPRLLRPGPVFIYLLPLRTDGLHSPFCFHLRLSACIHLF